MILRIMSVCAVMTTLAGAASADPVTFTFTGHVIANTFTTSPLLGVSVNDSATYRFTFESTTVGSYVNTGGSERYQYPNSITAGMIQVGSVSATSTAGTIIQTNGLTGITDGYVTNIWNTGLAPQVEVVLHDTTGTVFSPSSIGSLVTSLNLSAFTHTKGYINDAGAARMDILWTGLQIDNPVIPLPTTAAMAFVGLGMIGVRRHRNPLE